MMSVQSDGGFPIKLQIKTHILLECQWVRGDITRVEGVTEEWPETGGRSTGRSTARIKFAIFCRKFFSSSAAPSAVPSAPRIQAIISSVISQTSSEPRSNRIIPCGAAISLASIYTRQAIRRFSTLIPSGCSYPSRRRDYPSIGRLPDFPGLEIAEVSSPIPSSAPSFLMYFCSLFCTTAV